MGNFLHYSSIFVAGMAVGLSSNWQLTLVTVSVLPVLAVSGGLYLAMKTGQTARSQKAYAQAGNVAEEVSSLDLHHYTNRLVISSYTIAFCRIQCIESMQLSTCSVTFEVVSERFAEVKMP